jgi:hypothetical protein
MKIILKKELAWTSIVVIILRNDSRLENSLQAKGGTFLRRRRLPADWPAPGRES